MELEKKLVELSETLQKKQDHSEQLEKLLVADQERQSSRSSEATGPAVHAKQEQVEAQVGPAPSPDGQIPALDRPDTFKEKMNLRAQVSGAVEAGLRSSAGWVADLT